MKFQYIDIFIILLTLFIFVSCGGESNLKYYDPLVKYENAGFKVTKASIKFDQIVQDNLNNLIGLSDYNEDYRESACLSLDSNSINFYTKTFENLSNQSPYAKFYNYICVYNLNSHLIITNTYFNNIGTYSDKKIITPQSQFIWASVNSNFNSFPTARGWGNSELICEAFKSYDFNSNILVNFTNIQVLPRFVFNRLPAQKVYGRDLNENIIEFDISNKIMNTISISGLKGTKFDIQSMSPKGTYLIVRTLTTYQGKDFTGIAVVDLTNQTVVNCYNAVGVDTSGGSDGVFPDQDGVLTPDLKYIMVKIEVYNTWAPDTTISGRKTADLYGNWLIDVSSLNLSE